MFNRNFKLSFLVGVFACIGPMKAMGEFLPKSPITKETAEALADTSRVVDLDEVVVVSQPKEQVRLRLQPVSSSVFGSEQLQQLHVRDLSHLANYVPSFVMPQYGARLTSSMYVRGIGSRVNNPAVGVYYDNIPLMSKAAFNNHFYMLDRVDILRGPQGTLYGQNTEGGLVRIYSKNPMNYQGTDMYLGIGTGFYRNVEVAHHHRPSESLAFTVAGFYNGLDGFIDNQNFKDKNDKTNEAGGKVRLIFQPSQKLKLDWTTDYQYVNQNGFGYGELHLEDNEVDDPATTIMNGYKRNMLNTGLSVSYETSKVLFTSTTSYQFLRDQMEMDQDYMAADYLRLGQRQHQHAVTQEFSIKSNSIQTWRWAFGAFGSYQWLQTKAPVYFGSEMNAFLSKTIQDYAYYGMLNSMAQRMGMEAAAAMIERMGGCHIDMEIATIPGIFYTPQSNLGLFHESNIHLSDRLMAILGLRYDLTHVSMHYRTNAQTILDENVMGMNVKAKVLSTLEHKNHNDFSQLLPKIGLSYQLGSQGNNVYATVAKGYRAGGFNLQMFSDILQTELQANAQTARGYMEVSHDELAYDNIRETIVYDPEETWNYEFGTHLNLFGNSLHLDFAGFYMQVRNQQLSVMAGNYGFGRMMVNAGKSYSCGIELSLRGFAFNNHLTWSAGYGYTQAVFKDYQDSIKVDGVNTLVDYKDNRVPYVPEHTFSLAADYRIDVSNAGCMKAVVLGANLSGQGKTWWDEANTYSQGFYATIGAHADINFKNFTLSLWGRNLTDTNYNTFAVSSSAAGNLRYFAQRGNPVRMGLDVSIHL